MYPYFNLFWIFNIYTFWLTLTICFFIFLAILKKLCHRFWINSTFFFNRILWYFLSVFFFSRVFYVISNWDSFKFIQDPLQFFLMSDYNFSLFWAIFWYLLVLFITIIVHWLRSWKYVDVSLLSFLFTGFFGFIWAFLWGQVYGNQTNFWFEITYNTINSIVPYEVPVFPLPIFYSLLFIILFTFCYIISIFINIRWIVWYFWFILFWFLTLILENYSWKYDFFKIEYWINFNQISSIVLIIFSLLGLYRIYKMPIKSDIL